MLSFEISFSEAQLDKLLRRAISLWGGLPNISSVGLNKTDDPTRFKGTIHYNSRGGKTVSLSLSHEVLVQAVCAASASEGNTLDAATVTFKYNPGRGHGGGSSVSATAMTSSNPAPNVAQTPGKMSFPGTVEISFTEDEVKELLKAAVRRQGGNASSVSFNAQDGKASITVDMPGGKKGTVTWQDDVLKGQLIAELSQKGYVVEPAGIQWAYVPGAGFGGPPRHGFKATLTAIPTGS
jgi:hypothetical protein